MAEPTEFEKADLARKKAYIATLMNIATLFSQLDDISTSEGKYIVNKKWISKPITDADVAEYGVLAADVNNFFTLMTQFANLMSNKPVTTLQGRAFADIMRSR
jgi:hypothetical protein